MEAGESSGAADAAALVEHRHLVNRKLTETIVDSLRDTDSSSRYTAGCGWVWLRVVAVKDVERRLRSFDLLTILFPILFPIVFS